MAQPVETLVSSTIALYFSHGSCRRVMAILRIIGLLVGMTATSSL